MIIIFDFGSFNPPYQTRSEYGKAKQEDDGLSFSFKLSLSEVCFTTSQQGSQVRLSSVGGQKGALASWLAC